MDSINICDSSPKFACLGAKSIPFAQYDSCQVLHNSIVLHCFCHKHPNIFCNVLIIADHMYGNIISFYGLDGINHRKC